MATNHFDIKLAICNRMKDANPGWDLNGLYQMLRKHPLFSWDCDPFKVVPLIPEAEWQAAAYPDYRLFDAIMARMANADPGWRLAPLMAMVRTHPLVALEADPSRVIPAIPEAEWRAAAYCQI
jgi:hypothetical protein